MKLSIKSIIIFISVVVFTITATNSVGFFHADEHYQIIEFAGLKAGWNTPEDLVWEYHTKIRPTLQPTIAVGFISIFKFFGASDPYTISFLLREITALLLIFALVFFFTNTKRFIPSKKESTNSKLLEALYLGFLLLIWYIPYLGVRFSSETWSAIFLLFAMGCFCSENKSRKKILLTGLFFGLSFLFRFQILFALVGFGMWFLIFNRKNWKELLQIIGAFSLVFCFGILIDSIFYNEFTISVWNYFDQNILQHKAAEFGELPWDYYISSLFHLPTKLIGTLFFLSITSAIIFRNKAPFIWMIISFILLHMLVSHKEERFLFPIAFFFPLFFIQFFQLLMDSIPRKIALMLIGLTSLGIVTTSIVGLPILASSPAGLGRNGITRFIHLKYPNKIVNLIAMPYANPYSPWFRNEKFYLDKNVGFTPIDNFEALNSSIIKKNEINLFVTTQFFLETYPHKENIQKLGFKLIQQSIPEYQLKMDKYVRGIEDQNITYLYELKK
ncbi:mannosyltransferase [Fluviicola taffensis]|uniref:Alg9 family protein mannosyltransferase n=1 Tax=Fluviicola taffensis (strain DSM 16823 / NCIMB 13979 / RW262) TaxID=755732 RepID=F2ICN2_FLUTR|nr:mannosyltransferase [Fluviicola taffensis]AEA42259.1 Alg9 family protein mannosyltransferase [Fluviicola taffensis DSM 16823]